MSDTAKDTAAHGGGGVIARKLAATKEGKGALTSSLTLKALRRSIARAAADLCDLPVAVLAARQANRVPEDLAAHLSDKHLLVVLDGPAGRIGAATLDAPLVTALIQQQTMGQVLGKAPSERHYTPTDAAMVADFLERTFGKVVSMLSGQKDEVIFSGYRFGAQVENVRSLVLGLEAEDYRLIDLTVDLACGAMQGNMTLILPEPTAEDLGKANGSQHAGPSLGSNLGAMRAELQAVLCKMRVPANAFTSLAKGDLLPLDQAYLYETEMVAISGQVIAQGRLGQMNGARAVRLTDPKTKLVSETAADDTAFSTDMGGAPHALEDDAPMLDLSVAADGLQDPMDTLGGDLGGGLGEPMAGMGDLGDLGADFEAEFGGDLGGDLGGLPMGGGLGDGMGDALGSDLPDLGALPMGDGLGDFSAELNEDEVSELAGLNTGT
ncbi:FliM/FliN family flagellar motor C-terminal domain-containing protein [Phaeobacter italicus]|uniref:FliM/FliN family flagellar motor C-terminal domain-containing protein n=1 Tax=Phaeobacter italicus TaxID=481446 RepID=UPI001C959029|nr:FliM/FliN family flagellar motor C-terminal domain-containing protein [Phaeobacter italicus]MBY5975370.1 FliM/FliN family flagellar motor C-terminal domain-containing protein [Phaeobacter italicus]